MPKIHWDSWAALWADIDAHSCKICGIYNCMTHLKHEWVVCPGCPNSTKYWLKYHPKCPSCGAAPPVAQKG